MLRGQSIDRPSKESLVALAWWCPTHQRAVAELAGRGPDTQRREGSIVLGSTGDLQQTKSSPGATGCCLTCCFPPAMEEKGGSVVLEAASSFATDRTYAFSMPSWLLALHILAGATPLTPCEVGQQHLGSTEAIGITKPWRDPVDVQTIPNSGFLQQSLQLSEQLVPTPRIEKNEDIADIASLIVSDVPTVELVERGPSTENIDQDSFGSRVVHFPAAMFVVLAVIFAVVFIHEYLVSQGMRPILARCEEGIPWNALDQKNWMVMFVALSMTVPISLDFTLSLNQGATASGFFLSAGVLSGVLAFGVGKKLVDEGNWNQFYVRRLMIIFPLLAVCIDLLMAVFINETATSNESAAIWWTVILLGQVSAFFRGITAVPGAIFWSKITIPRRRTVWMVLTQCSRNLGLIIGPGIFLLINLALSRGPRVNPRSMMAWAAIIEATLYLFGAVFSMLIMPTRSSAMSESVRLFHEEQDMGRCKFAEVPLPEVWNMVCFSFERPFSLAALEACTVMLLEDPYYSGIVFPMVCSFGIMASLVTTLLIENDFVSEPASCSNWEGGVLLGAAILSTVSCLGLFEVGKPHVVSLLVASAGVYTGATAANGVAESWGSRAAKEKTNFRRETQYLNILGLLVFLNMTTGLEHWRSTATCSWFDDSYVVPRGGQGDFRLRSFTAMTTSRLLGPILGRFFVDYGGRNAYASLMLAVSILSCKTVLDTCNLLWKRHSDDHQVKDFGILGYSWQMCASAMHGDHQGQSFIPPEDSDDDVQMLRQKILEMNKMTADIDPSEHGAQRAGISLGAPEPPRRMAELRAAAERRLRSNKEPVQESLMDVPTKQREQRSEIPRHIRGNGAWGRSRTPGSPRATTPRGADQRPEHRHQGELPTSQSICTAVGLNRCESEEYPLCIANEKEQKDKAVF
eukprot:s199_g24.t1